MMNRITNPIYMAAEKAYLEFVLQHEFPERAAVLAQLNAMNEADLTRDVSLYYWIMEFRPGGINAGHGPMGACIQIEVLHGTAPTVFTLYMRNGAVFELEIYNADSSELDADTMMDGETIVRFVDQTDEVTRA